MARPLLTSRTLLSLLQYKSEEGINARIEEYNFCIESMRKKRKKPDFANIDLNGADLYEADFMSINLQKANFQEANLEHALLQHADLRGASFMGANLRKAKFFMADLRGANLLNANMEDTDLNKALYDQTTLFPEGFDASKAGMILKEIDGVHVNNHPDSNIGVSEITVGASTVNRQH